MINKPSGMNGLLDLDPNEVVLYVGGYPEDFKVNKSTKEFQNKANTFFDYTFVTVLRLFTCFFWSNYAFKM